MLVEFQLHNLQETKDLHLEIQNWWHHNRKEVGVSMNPHFSVVGVTTYLGHPHLRQSFDMSTFFQVHAKSNCQQLLYTYIMERTIFEYKEGEDDAQARR